MLESILTANGRSFADPVYMPDGKTGAPLQGQAILYFGDNASVFSNEFRNKGWLASIV